MEGNLHANKLANFGVICNSLTCDHMLVVKFNPLFQGLFLVSLFNKNSQLYKKKQTNWDKESVDLTQASIKLGQATENSSEP